MTHADSILVKTLEAHADSLQSKVDLLQAKLNELQDKTEFLSNVVETANDGVNNQLASATFWLEIIAILIVIVGGIVGYYINYKKQQIEEIASIVEGKKIAVERMARETEILDAKIRHNMSDLYKELRKEETNALLDRLVLEPQDIDNLCTILCARDIDEKGYEKLKAAYLKMKKMLQEPTLGNVVNDCSEHYLVLFYQHFFYQSLKDDEISPDFENYYCDIFARAYRRDVINSTIGLCNALSEETNIINKERLLISYLKALNGSQYNKMTELRNIFEQNIVPQTLLQDAIEGCKKENVKLVIFEDNLT